MQTDDAACTSQRSAQTVCSRVNIECTDKSVVPTWRTPSSCRMLSRNSSKPVLPRRAEHTARYRTISIGPQPYLIGMRALRSMHQGASSAETVIGAGCSSAMARSFADVCGGCERDFRAPKRAKLNFGAVASTRDSKKIFNQQAPPNQAAASAASSNQSGAARAPTAASRSLPSPRRLL